MILLRYQLIIDLHRIRFRLLYAERCIFFLELSFRLFYLQMIHWCILPACPSSSTHCFCFQSSKMIRQMCKSIMVWKISSKFGTLCSNVHPFLWYIIFCSWHTELIPNHHTIQNNRQHATFYVFIWFEFWFHFFFLKMRIFLPCLKGNLTILYLLNVSILGPLERKQPNLAYLTRGRQNFKVSLIYYIYIYLNYIFTKDERNKQAGQKKHASEIG